MRFSAYSHFIDGGQGTLAFNSRTGAFLSLTPDTMSLVSSAIHTASANSMPLSLQMTLLEFGFLVPDGLDETRFIRTRMFSVRFSQESLGLTIAPTLACNLKCEYCYETPVRSSQVMDMAVQEALVESVCKRVQHGQRVTLSWYGGEPLLVPDIVIRISRGIRKAVDGVNGTLRIRVVTNGTLLTQGFIDEMTALGGHHIQITLDGPPEVHDRRRPFAGGQRSSFESIISSLLSLQMGAFWPTIRCNIDRTNATTAHGLIDVLTRRNLSKFGIYAAAVQPIPGTCLDVGTCLQLDEFSQVRKAFETKARMAGFPAGSRPAPKPHYCGADSAFASTVAPDGSIYKCWNHIGIPELSVGSVFAEPVLVPEVSEWALYDPTQEEPCRTCSILPVCMGGCPDRRWRGTQESENCEALKREFHELLREWAADWSRGGETKC